MNFKEEIENLLNDFKNLDYDRRKIEQELSLGDKYIDQALSRGGNEKLLTSLKLLYKSILTNAMPDATTMITLDERATIKVLVDQLIRLQSDYYHKPEYWYRQQFDKYTKDVLSLLKGGDSSQDGQ